jgi:ELWxxDGT repeat protein
MIRRRNAALVERLEPRQLLSAAMVKDLNTAPSSVPGLWSWVGAGDTVFLSQEDGVAGWELYKTDGTTGGTVLVKDIRPGRDNSAPGWLTYAGNGTIFFTADDGSHGVELWKSDGTTAGTMLVKDINPGAAGSGAGGLVNISGTIYFSATDGVNGAELWKSDGTDAGTVMVKDISTGSSGFPSTPNSSSPTQLINNNGVLFFRATTTASGAELWKSDGTDAGTVQVTELYNNNNNGMANTAMAAVGGYVYFAGITSTGGTDVWRSDGTNTTRVKDLASGATPSNFKSAGGRAYYTVSAAGADFGLWSTDGTPPTNVIAATTQGWTDVNGTLFFGSGGTLYTTTGGVPTALKSGLSMATNTGPWTNAGGTLFFTANDGSGAGEELWKSNGTPDGTVMVKDVESGPTSSNPIGMTPYGPGGTSIIFGTFAGATTGGAIFRSDGTDPGTVFVKDINPATADSSPLLLTPFKNWMYFVASEPTYSNGTIGELYRTDGTEAGTDIAVDLSPGPTGAAVSSPRVFGNWLYFSGNDGSGIGKELWRTDGTSSQLVKDINPGSANGNPLGGVVSGNFLYFIATTAAQGDELWRTDGVDAGTVRLTDITAGPGGSQVSLMTDVGGTLYFTAFSTSTTFAGLWKTDGFTTTQVVGNTFFSSIATMLNVNGTLYISGTTPANGAELYKIAPGGSTPVLVKDINPTGNSSPASLTNFGGTLCFSATTSANGTELWKSDGTTAGTVMVADIRPGSSSGLPSQPNLTPANGVLYFRADDGANGVEVWRSDGTAPGTYMVKDIAPAGATSGIPNRLFAANGFVYFAANAYNGTTPDAWRSDGTPEGTVPISRFPKGTFLSFPSNAAFFAQMGGDIYYFFTDDTHGAELWKSDQPDFATLASGGGGGGVLTISGTGGNDAIDVSTDGSGLHVTWNGLTENFAPGTVTSLVIAGKVGVDTVNVTGGSVTFGGGDSGAATADLTVHVAPGAAATFAGAQQFAALVVDAGANAALAPGGNAVLVVNNLSIGGGGAAMNLNDNGMIIRGGSVSAVANLIHQAFNSGNWNGPGGITSATAAADPAHVTGVGYGTNAEVNKTSFEGVTGLTPADVLVKFTCYGDSDLSGAATLDDFTLFLNGYQNSGSLWSRGDYDFSGLVTLDDFTLFLKGYQQQGSPL